MQGAQQGDKERQTMAGRLPARLFWEPDFRRWARLMAWTGTGLATAVTNHGLTGLLCLRTESSHKFHDPGADPSHNTFDRDSASAVCLLCCPVKQRAFDVVVITPDLCRIHATTLSGADSLPVWATGRLLFWEGECPLRASHARGDDPIRGRPRCTEVKIAICRPPGIILPSMVQVKPSLFFTELYGSHPLPSLRWSVSTAWIGQLVWLRWLTQNFPGECASDNVNLRCRRCYMHLTSNRCISSEIIRFYGVFQGRHHHQPLTIHTWVCLSHLKPGRLASSVP